jgi:rhodanese-related sulfurtransferase
MNKKSLIFFVAFFFLLLVTLFIFTIQKEGDQSVFKNVSVEEAREMVKEDVFVLDVRTPAEFNSSHIEGATLIPVTNAFGSNVSSEMLLDARTDEIPQNKKILVYCRTGQRSTAASKILINEGDSQVYNMAGGINAWINAGYPVVSSPD